MCADKKTNQSIWNKKRKGWWVSNLPNNHEPMNLWTKAKDQAQTSWERSHSSQCTRARCLRNSLLLAGSKFMRRCSKGEISIIWEGRTAKQINCYNSSQMCREAPPICQIILMTRCHQPLNRYDSAIRKTCSVSSFYKRKASKDFSKCKGNNRARNMHNTIMWLSSKRLQRQKTQLSFCFWPSNAAST